MDNKQFSAVITQLAMMQGTIEAMSDILISLYSKQSEKGFDELVKEFNDNSHVHAKNAFDTLHQNFFGDQP